jgi:ATP-dependent Lon protease
MNEKGKNNKKEIENNKKDNENKKNNTILPLISKKFDFFNDIIQKTIIHVQKNKILDILSINDVNVCIDKLGNLSKKLDQMKSENANNDILINNLQTINNELSSLLKSYGTFNLEDLLLICFGNNNNIALNDELNDKFELLKKYFHPSSYKVVNKKEDSDENLTCSDVSLSFKEFHMKVFGIKIQIYSETLKKSLLIYGFVDDVVIDFLNNDYILGKKTKINELIKQNDTYEKETYEKFLYSLTLKDYLVYETAESMINKYMGYISQNNALRQKQISQNVKEFIIDDMYNKRNSLICLLICSSNYENQYLAYLLYDLLSNDANGNVDTQEQTIIFDSFPWHIKQYFKQAMKKTIQYTNELTNFDMNKIPIEQQICLMKATDSVKEKAMMKLKEVKAKSEDSGSKARQYLDGLLKIPFGVYKKEPILNTMNVIKGHFKDIYIKYNIGNVFPEIPNKENYTSIEVLKYVKKIKGNSSPNNKNNNLEKIKNYLLSGDKKTIVNKIIQINELYEKHDLKQHKIKYVTMNKDQLKCEIEKLIEFCKNENINTLFVNDLIEQFITLCNININNPIKDLNIKNDIELINNNMGQITQYMTQVKLILDKAVHGHEKAKKQVERIIGQWINGEQDGYCFGFEGPPGVGKTSLAKRGLSNCLKDDNGNSRPFSMIQMGGDSNGSTLHGHNYTYVGSTWGSIVQILIDKKCMNPIIFIDEVDKISRTEHGKEIVGILTHLLDPTQNDCFQDKYFNGIDVDLSKALFILSYNDVEAIDKILLDRVHRIKFNSLTIEDKLIISKTHILPEVYKKMGLEDIIIFSDEVLKFIIEEYTLEAGVRKLKEILFEIVGEINLDILVNNDKDYDFPIVISINDIKTKYFKDKREIKVYKIHNESKVGVINALWANQMAQGGVLPIQASFIPSSKFLELTLTGSMGEVMKESISVSLTNAWNLTSVERQKYLIEKYNDIAHNSVFGIHIHCPDISTKKDGPSATTAFTILIYSIFNNIKIKNYFGITGETHFGHLLTEIGGLQEKLIHSIKAGVTEFIFPKENQTDFDKIMEKYKDNDIIKGIKFHSVNHINEVIDLILEKPL